MFCINWVYFRLAFPAIPEDWESECGINTESSSNDDKNTSKIKYCS